MTIITGAKAGFWCPQVEDGSNVLVSTAATGEAMTQVGTTLEYFIAERTKCWWDPNKAVVVKVDGSAVTPSRIDYAGGYVTLVSATVLAVTVDIYYFAMEALGGAYGWKADLKSETKEVTVFPGTLNTATAWKEYISTLEGWNCSISRHFFVAKASVTTAIATANANLKWEWKSAGRAGNTEALVYEAGAELQIARASNITTVTYVAATTTAADVKAHLDADPVLAALWDVSYLTTDWTAGYHTGGQNPSVDISGGTDTSFNIKADSESTATLITLTVAGLNSGANIAAAMQTAIRAKGGAYTSVTVTYEGSPITDYYLITSGTTGAASAITITPATTANVADNLKIGTASGGTSTAGTAASGAGAVGAVSHVHATGGRDSADIARLGTKVLAVMYINNTTGAVGKLEGVGNMTGLGPDCKLEALVECDVTIEGTGALRYHTV